MILEIRYAPEAVRDLEAVWDGVYEVSENADIADRYLSGLVNEIEEKKEFPLSGIPLTYRRVFTGFYSVNYKKYKAFYRVNGKYIEVLRVIPAKRDYMTVLFGEPEDDSYTNEL